MSSADVSILWSLSVVAEVVVFVGLGPRLVEYLGPRLSLVLVAAAGIIRWGTAALTASFPLMALVEPLHGLTFALLHLTCMDVIVRVVPKELAATAQAFYATVAMGAVSALITVASGPLYGSFGASSFWGMALMCSAALPLAWSIFANQSA
ncbi:MFS transporter [Acidisphaera sp. L21]|uniref:MFS transporter n=1 Tax=Acidisphaera sp. L21 TaxID=1641851 RepID=UPI00131C5595